MHMTQSLPRKTLLQQMMHDAPLMTRTGIILALSTAPTIIAMGIDPRQFGGESVWIKPLKFEISLALYTLTLAFFARYVPSTTRASRRWIWFERVVIACIAAEMAWIGGAAALGTGSHFNLATGMSAMLYRLMGAAAVTLTAASLTYGISIWRNRHTGLPRGLHDGIALSLIATFVATVIAAGTLAAGTGHFIGAPVTGASWPIMGWSREVGDLRIAHFLAAHTMHIVPFAALLAAWATPAIARPLTYLALTAYLALTIFAYVTALRGLPLI